MVGVRCVAVAAPGFAPGARDPGFTPAAFGGECFYDLYLAVDEGAEGGAAGADHADGEFELTVCVSLSAKKLGAVVEYCGTYVQITMFQRV